jgi:uncharacterized protein YjbI with pentapeptide repeats
VLICPAPSWSKACLKGANLSDAKLTATDLAGADLTNANLSGADGLFNSKDAIFYNTILPDGSIETDPD